MKLLAVLLGSVLAYQQVDPAQEDERGGDPRFRALNSLSQLVRQVEQIGDWESQREQILTAVELVYERQGWLDEPDLFSLDVITEVSAHPPWAFGDRLDTFVTILGDRYRLDAEQQDELRGMVVETAGGLIQRNLGRIASYMGEVIQTRAAGEPFTPEQVARWMQAETPVFEDVVRSLNDGAKRFMETLEPEQRELVERDMQFANRRLERVRDMRQSWLRGEWAAEDWGLDLDPIQNGHFARGDGGTGGQIPPGQAGVPLAAGDGAGAAGADGRPRLERGAVDRPAGAVQGGAPQGGERQGEFPPHAGDAGPGEPAARRGVARGGAAAGGAAAAGDPWAAYVRDFIRRFDLNEDQQQTAWRVYRDAAERRDQLVARWVQVNGAAAGAAKNAMKPTTGAAAEDDGARSAGRGAAAEERRGTAADERRGRGSRSGDADRAGAAGAGRATGGDDVGGVAVGVELTESQRQTLARLFEQIKRRLDRLPTRAQRAAADSASRDQQPADAGANGEGGGAAQGAGGSADRPAPPKRAKKPAPPR